ncbi:MAG: type II secretion system ATPase GspE, partial [Rhizomicrobium sp.]
MFASEHSNFARHLVAQGKLAEAALERAKRARADESERLEVVLTRLGLISERDLADTLAGYLELPLAAASEFPDAPILEDRLGRKFLRERHLVPIEDRADGIVIAMAYPLDAYATDAVRFAVGKPVLRKVAVPSDLDAAFERLYGDGKSAIRQIVDNTKDRASETRDDDVDRLKDIASEAPVIRLVNLLIARAVESRASDIHIEPTASELRVRYRIDGVLQQVESPPQRLSSAVISRIKIMAKLNIAERRLPQDGRIGIAVRGKDIDLRVAISPTIHGERVTLRILDREHVKLDFAALGFDDGVAGTLRGILNKPYGIFLVTGPTGSGKTTTLYAALLELNKTDTNILTIEDPVEYQLAGVNQVQVKPQIGLTFAHALRSFLRQDPDIMMVGEIRDLDTAQIAVQAALTGHLILSTVHTNDAASTITRLLDMGIEDYLLTSTVNGIAAQRLVRTLCSACREEYVPLPELVEKLRLPTEHGAPTLHRAVGCAECGDTGYRGRSSIVEILPMTEDIRQAVLKSADASRLHTLAVEGGMQTMYEHGLQKALAGVTSIEEVLR